MSQDNTTYTLHQCEMGVLEFLLEEPGYLKEIVDIIDPYDFSEPERAVMFKAIIALDQQGSMINEASLLNHLAEVSSLPLYDWEWHIKDMTDNNAYLCSETIFGAANAVRSYSLERQWQ